MSDPISDFVECSHAEKGKRVSLKMKKECGTAGFCLKISGGKEAVKRFAEIMNNVDLEEHQLPKT